LRLIYLSPHLDDAVYSCGGRIWQDVHRGDIVEIWTIFAGDPAGELSPFARELHARWGSGVEAMSRRRAEDRSACRILGAGYKHLAYADCIYRRLPQTGAPLIQKNEDLFMPIQAGEEGLVQQITAELLALNPQKSLLICPLSLGGHMDHRITRAAAEQTGFVLAYYADYPYAADPSVDVSALVPGNCRMESFALDEEAVEKWAQAIAAYTSQLSSFWTSIEEMRTSLAEYSRSIPGCTLWKCNAYSHFQ
jgi:LmbE family N-acetylglucosaminyl deacetylase